MALQRLGNMLVKGSTKIFNTVAEAQASKSLIEGDKVRTLYYNTDVISDWVYHVNKPTGFSIPAFGGYLLLMTPSFAAAGLKPGAYDPITGASNRNIIQSMLRDTRWAGFKYGAKGLFYATGSIHPQRGDINIWHESGVTLLGRYDDPSLTPAQMGLNAGQLFGFALYVNPDALVWDDANYAVTGTIANVIYQLDGAIGTEFNSVHSKLHNNNALGFYQCRNCHVRGRGGVIMSDHRGVNFDGNADNCSTDIAYATGTSNSPLLMKVAFGRTGSVKVGSVYGIKFDDQALKAVVWASGGIVDVEIGDYRWDGVIKPIILYANTCQEASLKFKWIAGASQLIRQYDTQVTRLRGGTINSVESLVNYAEQVFTRNKVTDIQSIIATDTVLTSAYYAETQLGAPEQVIIKDCDFRAASPSFLYYKGKTGAGTPRMWTCMNNLDPNGLVDFSDWNILVGGYFTTTVSATTFNYTINRRYTHIDVSLTENSTMRMVRVSIPAHLGTTTTASYVAGGTSLTVSRSGDVLTFTVLAGIINYYTLSN